MRYPSLLRTLGLALLAGTGAAAAGTTVEFRSPNGVVERCVALSEIPRGVYSDADRAEEAAFCGIDFYSDDVAICPKIWSTSPATIVHDVSAGPWAHRGREFEEKVCSRGTHARDAAHGELAAFKITMNAKDTSATFSTASLLYYHFARYLDAATYVPVAVYRSMDRRAHHDRIALRGIRLTEGQSSLKMIHTAWRDMVTDEETPGTYQPARDVFTPDRNDVFGVLLNQEGSRYSEVINGTRESGWGDGQSRDFQRTPPFVALATAGPLAEAIAAGRAAAAAHAKFRQLVTPDTPDAQFVFWMQELTEITLLDYVFSQQDRIGNIDYVSYWYWVENGRVLRERAAGDRPAGIPADALRLRRTHLNDNDAGARVQYANYTKRTGMLEAIRHYAPDTYRRLQALAADFRAEGPLFRYAAGQFGLATRELAQLTGNTIKAAEIMAAACRDGRLRFDLDPEGYLLGRALPPAPACDGT